MYWGFEFFDWTVKTRLGFAHNGFFLQWNALVLIQFLFHFQLGNTVYQFWDFWFYVDLAIL